MKKITIGIAAAFLSAAFSAFPVLAEEVSLMNPPVVELEKGALMGYMDEGVYTFLGIPYAQAERFEMPQEVETWDGIKNAQSYGTTAPVPKTGKVGADEFIWPHRYWIESEDCQNLNVWSSDLDSEEKKPVMVFLHGGGLYSGSAMEAAAYDGRNLAEFGDVVVVTVNHRINAAGYLDLSSFGEEYQYSSMVGTADTEMALRWVQDNIAEFGGDPDNVTIFGQSSGGGKVYALMHVPTAEGLFDKAIIQSTDYVSKKFGIVTKEQSRRIGELTAECLGLTEETIDEIKEVPYEELLDATTEALALAKEEFPENKNLTVWALVPDNDYMLDACCDWTDDMPLMMGAVYSESDRAAHKIGDGRLSEWTDEEAMAKLTEAYGDRAEAIAAEFLKVFPEKTLADAYFYSADGRERMAVSRDIMREEGSEDRPIYDYFFTYEAPVNGGTPAFHCSELMYVFHNIEIPVISRATGGTEEALQIQDICARAWTNFAATGDPSQDGYEWEPYTEENKNTMIFDIESGERTLDDAQLRTLILEK